MGEYSLRKEIATALMAKPEIYNDTSVMTWLNKMNAHVAYRKSFAGDISALVCLHSAAAKMVRLFEALVYGKKYEGFIRTSSRNCKSGLDALETPPLSVELEDVLEEMRTHNQKLAAPADRRPDKRNAPTGSPMQVGSDSDPGSEDDGAGVYDPEGKIPAYHAFSRRLVGEGTFFKYVYVSRLCNLDILSKTN